jgi:adenylate cyclase
MARPARILAVDDNKQNLTLLEKALVAANYEILTASDGPTALDMIGKESPDLILLDVMMPGMSGYDVCRRLRADEATRLLPVVMLTALSDVKDRIAGIDAGADDFLSKPFHREELLTRVRSLLRIKTLHDDLEAKNRLLRTLFGRYVSEDVAAEIIRAPDQHLGVGGQKREVTVLFGDLRGFTPMAETLDPQDVVDILNAYLTYVVDTVFEHGGTLDKFRGDGIMAVFGAPVAHADDPRRAVSCALAMSTRVRAARFAAFPDLRLQMGIGINTGVVIAGNIGSERRMDYTVIGDQVNLAQRLESSAGPGQILIAGATYERVRDRLRVGELGEMRLRGRHEGVTAYDVIGWRDE